MRIPYTPSVFAVAPLCGSACTITPSTLERERAEGRQEHAVHGGAAVKTRTASYIGIALFGFGIVGLVIGIAFWAVHK
jgi:hypothetical protein